MKRGAKQHVRNKNLADMKDRMRKKASKIGSKVKKICLTMIVRNESKNMVRLFESVKTIIDMISIVDTGSTDNTKEVIEKWGKENNIPTIVHYEPFKNFSYNRTHSVKIAKKTYPDADYFLLSDADFVWDVNKGGKFDKSLLVDHKYLIEQYNKALSYWNIRLLSSKVDFECVGVTHEYWGESKTQKEYTGDVRTSKITTLAIDDREDGGCKSDKFDRDEKLLREGLADKESTSELKTRYKFYLAQTLKDVGRYEESIEWYTKRVEDKGWGEEVYYAKFQIGFNYEQLGWRKKQAVSFMGKNEKSEVELKFIEKWNPNKLSPAKLLEESTTHFTDAGINYLAAYKYRSTRAESLYHVTRMYRSLSMNELAYSFALLGNTIKYPNEDSLFIERNCYDYLFDYELSIVSFYVPDKKETGREAVSKLMKRDDLPEWITKNIETISRHYI